jgi:hypothetical protein
MDGFQSLRHAVLSIPLMVIHDFHVLGVPVLPVEANAELVVDANAVLPLAVRARASRCVPGSTAKS